MQVFKDYRDGTLTLGLCGELDHNAAASVMRAAEEAIEEFLPRRFVMDCSGLSFMDSSGIAVLLKTETIMRQIGGEVRVKNANEQASRVLKLSGMHGLITTITQESKECEFR